MSRRIALISGDFPPLISGIGDYVEKLAAAMAREGGDVTVITSTNHEGSATYDFPVLRIMPSWTWADRHLLVDTLAEFDIAHIQYPSIAYGRDMMINVLPRLLRRKHPSTKSIVTIHDFRTMRWRWRARVAPTLWTVDGLVYVDACDGPVLQSWMPFLHTPSARIPIAANAEPVACPPGQRDVWRRELGFAPDEIVVAFFGMLYPHKGLPELDTAIQQLRKDGKRVRLLVLGDFDREADWRPGMEALLAQSHVVWVKGAPLDRISECLHASDLAALPFHSGASTNRGSLLATMAHGLPTVTTQGPHTPANFGQEYDLSLVPIQSADRLHDALLELMQSPTTCARMRESALEKMSQMTWPAIARQTLAFYDRLLAPSAKGYALETA